MTCQEESSISGYQINYKMIMNVLDGQVLEAIVDISDLLLIE